MGALIDLDNLKQFLQIDNNQNDNDDLLENLILKVEQEVKTFTKRTFIEATFTEYQPGNGTKYMLTKEFPISSVTSLHDDTDEVYGSSTEIPADDIKIYPEEGKIALDPGNGER